MIKFDYGCVLRMKSLINKIIFLIILCFSMANAISVEKNNDTHTQLSKNLLGSIENPIRVGVMLVEPYAKVTHGHYSGLVIDYWDIIAKQNNWHYELISASSSYDQTAKDVYENKFDIAIGNFSSVTNRMDLVNYSRPFLINYITILTNLHKITLWTAFLKILQVLKPILITLAIIFIFTILCALQIEKKNKKKGFKKIFISTLMTLIGGLTMNKNPGVLILWVLFLSLCFKAIIVGSTTATILEVSQVGRDPFFSKNDISGKRFVAIKGSAYVHFIKELNGLVYEYDGSAKDAISFYVENNKDFDGFVTSHILGVYNKDRLRKTNPDLYVSDLNIRNDALAFYYNKNFPYQNNVNKAIVTLQDKDIAAGICAKYFKEESDACIL